MSYDDGGGDGGNEDDSHKPRRLEEDTITYLMQLDKQLHADSIDPDDQEILVENVLDEIKQRTASAACDRRTNMIIERLCYAAKLKQLVEIVSRLTPYAVFLARNRHSSHILQAILARLCFILKNEGIGNVDEDFLKTTMLGFLSLILKEIGWLAKELSASHVVRSALCALAGIPIVAERKGKESKHKHAVSLSEPLESLLAPGKFYIDRKKAFSVPEEFHELLGEAAASLLTLSTADLQGLIADSSSCAVVSLMLRILFSPEVVMGGPALADRLARVTLGAGAAGGAESEEELVALKASVTVGNMFYTMAGDRSGSYFLESVVECCEVPLLLELLHGSLYGSVKEYAEDGTANFVLQAALRRLSAELEGSTRSPAQLAALEATADKCLAELTANDFYPYLVLQRGGVVLWMLDLARFTGKKSSKKSSKKGKKEPSEGDEIPAVAGSPDWREVVGTGLLSTWTKNDSDPADAKLHALLADKLSPKAAATSVPVDDKGPGAKGAKGGKGKDGKAAPGSDRDSAQQLGARLTAALLKLPPSSSSSSSTPSGSSDAPSSSASARVARAVAALPLGTLKHVATSGPLSRAVLDTFFEHCTATDPPSSSGEAPCNPNTAALLASLTTFAAELAEHSIGQHVLRRAYEKADAAAKENIVVALDAAKEKLGGTKEGRNSLRIVQADLYGRQPEEWRAHLRRQSRAKDLLSELDGVDATGRPARPTFMTSQSYGSGGGGGGGMKGQSAGQDELDEAEGAGAGKRKRKRKRHGGKNDVADDEPAAPIPVPVPAPVKAHKPRPPPAQPHEPVDMQKIMKLKSAKNLNVHALTSDIEQLSKKAKK
jgi:hypothetical protein